MRKSIIFLLSLLCATLVIGCEKRAESLDAEYGYVQFRLLKEAQMESSSRSSEELEWLSDATKIPLLCSVRVRQ